MTSPPKPVTPEALIPRPPDELLRYVESPRDLIAGNRVRVLHNGSAAFPAMLDAIDGARERVSLEMYIFEPGIVGDRFSDALIGAARRGLQVRLLYDFIGCRNAPPSFFARMRQGGVHTIVYHAYRFWRPRFWALFRRNHRKTLVCDGRVAYTGGFNIANEWVSRAEGGGDWRDAAIEVAGPAVSFIEGAFLHTWNRRSKKAFRLQAADPRWAKAAGDVKVGVIANTELLDRFAIRRAALHAIRESRRRVYLANPYFVPDRGILGALRRAARRGVDVRVLVPARSDFRFLDYASRATFGPLLVDGVRIWMHDSLVHTKALVVDDEFVSIGSYNLDHRSLAYNLEMVVNVLDRATASDASRMIELELAESVQVSRAVFEQRPLIGRLIERIAYRLRYWL